LTVWRTFLAGFLIADAVHTIGACFRCWDSFLVAGMGFLGALLLAGVAFGLLFFVAEGKRFGVVLAGFYVVMRAGVVLWIVGVRRPLMWVSLSAPLRVVILGGAVAAIFLGGLLLLKTHAHKRRQEKESADKPEEERYDSEGAEKAVGSER